MDDHQANKIYDVLLMCGAAPDDRQGFVQYAVVRDNPLEWRFGGKLGFGGKFHFHDRRIRCNREDETNKRLAIMAKANAALAQLFDAATSGGPA
ncbi:hypothetical protein [Burkholderia gladioli]|uniref:hypothetical protein n=1 Tax=Burkholderia gladioli TaxID=28095 RepID=UPI00164173B0|nr:hypothetical protein [Burkholderia gladioli]